MSAWLSSLSATHPVAHAVMVLALVAVTGLALGSVRVAGIGLGVAGILFTGLAFGHFGFEIDHTILEFTREFGLVLFVYTVGMQVGPGFFTSLRKQGFTLNMLAFLTVVLGAVVALGLGCLARFPIAATVGLFCGATTNTPSLGAAQETLKNIPNLPASELGLTGLAYAAAYPFGIIGIILTMLGLRWVLRVDLKKEAAASTGKKAGVERLAITITDSACVGQRLEDIPALAALNVTVTRIRPAGQRDVQLATPETILRQGDTILAIGTSANLATFCDQMGGRTSTQDLINAAASVRFQDVVVTRAEVVGRSIEDLDLIHLLGASPSRLIRVGVEMTAMPELRLQFGDRVRLVGSPESLQKAAALLGNSTTALRHTHFIPVFVGIALGVLLGTMPLPIPGIPAPITLGLAGGPLVVSILLSRLGRLGPLIWYMPVGANLALRELGIILFLACVGLKAGGRFVDNLIHGDGLLWMACAAGITLVPLITAGLISRLVLKHNFLSTCGLLAGTMTDPPALAFANSMGESEGASVAYATVYPLTMLLRIIAAQVIVLFFV
jgi:putative transport protein